MTKSLTSIMAAAKAAGFTMKNIRQGQGREGISFAADILLNGAVVGDFLDVADGGEPRISLTPDARTVADAIIKATPLVRYGESESDASAPRPTTLEDFGSALSYHHG